jgi:hypothetical protein
VSQVDEQDLEVEVREKRGFGDRGKACVKAVGHAVE